LERVAVVVERTGERIGCLLNPESLVLRRLAGVRPRESAGGLVTGSELADDPVFFTGGGVTELTLNLLFDVQLPGSSIASGDVRELTGPLWQLAENTGAHPERRLPAVRFVWGKAVNVRGVVSSVAERLEYFTPEGVPQRSWLRMRLLRVAESDDDLRGGALAPPRLPEDLGTLPDLPDGPSFVHPVIGEGDVPDETEPAASTERLDNLAYEYFGDPAQWRVLAWLNDIADPLRLRAGQIIEIATETDVRSTAE